MEVELKEWGNSLGIILPAETLREFGVGKGDKIDISIVAKKRIDGFGVCHGAKPFKEDSESHKEFW
ncbi:AbrB/MazE/SpoVT family DNA-binding domain-containing protein [Candidatus Woesearchaeota archaeon]|nr:AbrB/MazE/SpoVT family DNA-binding domain-containing protein [Candidatus Woesearchaeota archaeon]